MIKGLGIFCIGVYLLLCTQLGGFAPGFSIYFLCVLAVVAGAIGLLFLMAPLDVTEGAFSKIKEKLPMEIPELCDELENLAVTIRRDGLLSLETRRRDLKDPLLRYLLKKVMDGFERGQLLPVLRNQAVRRAELIRTVEAYLDRFTSALPTLGLVPSLFMMMDYLNAPKIQNPVNSLPTIFIPFMLTLLAQLLIQAWTGKFFEQLREEVKLYYVILEEGVSGIQEGMNSELLRDKLRARYLSTPKWNET